MSSIIHYLSIEKVALQGYGIGFHEGKAVFVPYTMPGDCVDVDILISKKDVIFGSVREFIHTADISRFPGCDAFGGEHPCGGCDWLMAPYTTQLFWKTGLIKETFTPLQLSHLVQKTIPSPQPEYYRNKSFMPVGSADLLTGEPMLYFGMYARYSHQVIPHRQCLLQPPVMDEILQTIASFADKAKLEAYNEAEHSGLLRHVGIRINQSGSEILVILVTRTSKFPFTNQLIRTLTDTFPQIRGIIQNINRSPGNVILGSEDKLLYGSYYLQETLGKICFRIHYQSFFQINTGTTELLYRHLAAFLSPDQIVLDAYCGIGSIGLFIANSVKQVIGIEEVASAITDAEYNREQNGITNAIFHTGKVEDLLPILIQKHSFDTIILDPPRKGVDGSALAAIAQHNIPQILYVSCNPMTLARDIKLLCGQGYQVRSIQPFDMFPQTWHIETVVQLTKIMQD